MAGSGKHPGKEALKNKSMLVVRNITKQEVTNVIFPNGITVGTIDLHNGAKVHGNMTVKGIVNARDVRINGESIAGSGNINLLLFSLSSPIFAFDGPSDYTASPQSIVMTALQVSQSSTLKGTDFQLLGNDGTNLTASLGSDTLAETSTGNSAYQVTTTYNHGTMSGKFPLTASVTHGGVTRSATITKIESEAATPSYTFLAWGDPAVLQVQASSTGVVSGLTSADYLQIRARRGTTGIAFNEQEDGDVSSSGADTFALNVDGYAEVTGVATTESGQTFNVDSIYDSATNKIKFKDGSAYVLTLLSGFATVAGTKCSKLTVESFAQYGETYSTDPIARIDLPIPVDANSNGTNVSDNVTLSIVKVFAGSDGEDGDDGDDSTVPGPAAIEVSAHPPTVTFAADHLGSAAWSSSAYYSYIRVYEGDTELTYGGNVSVSSVSSSQFVLGTPRTETHNGTGTMTSNVNSPSAGTTGDLYVYISAFPSNATSGSVTVPIEFKRADGTTGSRNLVINYSKTDAAAPTMVYSNVNLTFSHSNHTGYSGSTPTAADNKRWRWLPATHPTSTPAIGYSANGTTYYTNSSDGSTLVDDYFYALTTTSGADSSSSINFTYHDADKYVCIMPIIDGSSGLLKSVTGTAKLSNCYGLDATTAIDGDLGWMVELRKCSKDADYTPGTSNDLISIGKFDQDGVSYSYGAAFPGLSTEAFWNLSWSDSAGVTIYDNRGLVVSLLIDNPAGGTTKTLDKKIIRSAKIELNLTFGWER